MVITNNIINLNSNGHKIDLSDGLYVVTSNDGQKDNGLIVNTISQVRESPNRISVTIDKKNYSHDVIKQTSKMNVNCLIADTPYLVFETFGFQSGKNVSKFESCTPPRSNNELIVLPKHINGFFSLKVEQYIDLDTQGQFICSVTEADVFSDKDSMTNDHYHNHVKPKDNHATY